MLIKKATFLSISNAFLKVENGLEKINTTFDKLSFSEFVFGTRIAIQQDVGEC